MMYSLSKCMHRTDSMRLSDLSTGLLFNLQLCPSSMEMFHSTVVGTSGLQQLKETNSSEKVSRERLGTTPATEWKGTWPCDPQGPQLGLWRSVSTDYSPYVSAQLFATTLCQAWRDSCRLTAWLIRGLIALDSYSSDMVAYWFDKESFIWILTSLNLFFSSFFLSAHITSLFCFILFFLRRKFVECHQF